MPPEPAEGAVLEPASADAALAIGTSRHAVEPAHTPAGDDLLDRLIESALHQHCTALAIDPGTAGVQVRARRDGRFVEWPMLEAAEAGALIAAIRQRAELGAPDGAGIRHGGFATANHRRIAVTALAGARDDHLALVFAADPPRLRTLTGLGMSPDMAAQTAQALAGTPGLILIAGASGSGRSTTLAALVAQRAQAGVSRILRLSADLPAPIDRVVDLAIGPASAAVPAVRAAPDLAFELCALDPLDDGLALCAALDAIEGGCSVVATLDADSAVSALVALRTMRVDSFTLAGAVRLVLAQRRVRRLCRQCRKPVQASGSVSALLGVDPGAVVFKPQGCSACDETGFDGETAVFEAIVPDPGLRRLIHDHGDAAILARHAYLKAPTLGAAARALVRDGVITAEDAIAIGRSMAATRSA